MQRFILPGIPFLTEAASEVLKSFILDSVLGTRDGVQALAIERLGLSVGSVTLGHVT